MLVLHPYYQAVGHEWLSRLGLPDVLMFATCLGEIILAGVVLRYPTNLLLAVLQSGAILCFTLILASLEPMLLVHPFGMLTKNIPIITTIWASYFLNKEGMNQKVLNWLKAGVVCIWFTEGLFPKLLFQQSLEIDVVAGWGFSAETASMMIRAVGLGQIASAGLLLGLRGRLLEWLYLAQLAALLLLPLMVTAQLPLMWFHPFGPLTKNIPIIISTFVLWREGAKK